MIETSPESHVNHMNHGQLSKYPLSRARGGLGWGRAPWKGLLDSGRSNANLRPS